MKMLFFILESGNTDRSIFFFCFLIWEVILSINDKDTWREYSLNSIMTTLHYRGHRSEGLCFNHRVSFKKTKKVEVLAKREKRFAVAVQSTTKKVMRQN